MTDTYLETKWTTFSEADILASPSPSDDNLVERLIEIMSPALIKYKEIFIALEGNICYFAHLLNHQLETRFNIEFVPENSTNLRERLLTFNDGARKLLREFLLDHPAAYIMVMGYDGNNRPLYLIGQERSTLTLCQFRKEAKRTRGSLKIGC